MKYSSVRQQALLLSKEEAEALLDLCLPGLSRADRIQERALQKLMALAHLYMKETESVKESDPVEEAAGRMEADTRERVAPSSASAATGFSPKTVSGARRDFDEGVVERILVSISA